MPIFEYACKRCDHRFESIVQGSVKPACPACGSRALAKQLSVFAVGTESDTSSWTEPAGPCGTCGDPRGPGACPLG